MTKYSGQLLLLLVFALPQSVFAAGAAIADASLHNGGTLYGQLVDEEGNPRKAIQVVLRHGQEVVAVGKTDVHGRFAVSGLQAGVYQVETAHSSQVYRLWAPTTAPPAAQQSILIVTGNGLVRGQVDTNQYGTAIRGAIAGGLLTGLTYWALDYNPTGS